MKDKDLKQFIKQSEYTTSIDFTDKLIEKIEAEKSKSTRKAYWSTSQIIVGFSLLAMVSGFLFHKISNFIESDVSIAAPFCWSLILLFGLSHTLTISKYAKMNN